jgi:hypothetical protein
MAQTVKRHPAAHTQAATQPAASAPGQVVVRMYRQGLGDCFLITMPKKDGTFWRMLIDCGVILGTANTVDRLRETVANLVGDTGGHVDVLVITHEHYDHVAAFAELPELFCPDGARRTAEQLQIGEVWFAWTENPSDPLGRKLNKARADQVNRLAAMVGGLRARNRGMTEATGRMADDVAELVGGFFGIADFAQARAPDDGQAMAAAVGGTTPHLGATARAMQNARALGGDDGRRVRYWQPGDMPWTSADVPGVRIYALGPPRDETLLKKTFATDAVYHLAAGDVGYTAFFGATGLGAAASGDSGAPFDALYGRALGDGAAMPDATRDFLQQRYYGPSSDAGGEDQSWRRIDEDWLGSAAQFALNLDSATNNTSLVLAIELSPGGEVLLFPADAQVGNWLSWQKLQWTIDGKTLTAPDLLRRTIFYKVGHHGSHNATLREQGLELMPHGLAAFIPVDHDMAVKKRWNGMPLPGLIAALKERDCAVVRIDEALPNDKRFRAGSANSRYFNGPLYYEWAFQK